MAAADTHNSCYKFFAVPGAKMMMEKNSDAIAQVIIEWLDRNVPVAPRPN